MKNSPHMIDLDLVAGNLPLWEFYRTTGSAMGPVRSEHGGKGTGLAHGLSRLPNTYLR